MKKTILEQVQETIAQNVKFDEKIDMLNEPTDTTEDPDSKTYSKKPKGGKIKYLAPQVQDTNLAGITAIEAAWKKNKASDSPEETVQENVQMTKASIKSIVKHANALMMGLNPTNEMCLSEGWIQSKITIIEDYLKAVHDYVMYYEESSEEDTMEESD
jgi:hypothetical protein